MTPLAEQLAEARWLLAQLPSRDLITLMRASPPAGSWSQLLARLIRDELHRREYLQRKAA